MTIKPDLTVPVPPRLDAVHFVGIGGAGMSGIAALFLAAGARVSGSDRSRNAATDRLGDAGATIAIGHAAVNVGEVDAVVVTSALWPDNPELLEARRRGVPVLHRSQALNALIAGRRLVAVAGAHGKTTSTAMLAVALDALGADPSFVIGGVSADFGVASRAGSGGVFVVEADESDGSFLLYDTSVALILNVDADHLDHYGTEQAFEEAFVAFADRAREVAVVSADDPGAQRVAARITGVPVRTVGESAGADVRISEVTTDGGAAGTLTAGGESVRIRLRVPGRHNIGNAAAVVAVLLHLGHPLAAAAAAVERFGGTGRRFELKGRVDGVSVYDDYAHLPAEVDAALTAARTVLPEGRRIIAVHQPHLYSRTAAMAGRFAAVLERTADHTVVLDVDGAREDPVEGVTGLLVSERFADAAKVDYEPDWDGAAARVAALARPGDFVVTLGCGSVYRLVPRIVDELGKHPAPAR